jgi:hypothetical protein
VLEIEHQIGQNTFHDDSQLLIGNIPGFEEFYRKVVVFKHLKMRRATEVFLQLEEI